MTTRSRIKQSVVAKPWNRLPSSKWLQALDDMIQLAERIGDLPGYRSIIERSNGSEARYLHLERGDTWFGIRIAAHFPFYACSRDYYQILLYDPPTDQAIDYTKRQIRDLVHHSQQVVANPLEVEAELRRRAGLHLSVREIARLRHQMNERAKWVWELKNSAVQ